MATFVQTPPPIARKSNLQATSTTEVDENIYSSPQFECSTKTSIISQVRRLNSTRTTDRPAAVLNSFLRDDRHYLEDVTHGVNTMIRTLIKSSNQLAEDLKTFQQGFLEEQTNLSERMKKTHDRAISAQQQKAAAIAENVYYETIAGKNDTSSSSSSSSSTKTKTKKKPRYLRARPLFSKGRRLIDTGQKMGFSTIHNKDSSKERQLQRNETATMQPIAIAARKKILEDTQNNIASNLDEISHLSLDDLPYDIRDAMIKDIHDINDKKKPSERKYTYGQWHEGLTLARFRPPTIPSMENMVSQYKRSPPENRKYPNRRNNDTTDPEFYAAVLSDMRDATSLNATPNLRRVKQLITKNLLAMAKERGQSLKEMSKSSNDKIIKVIRCLTKTTLKSDNGCSTEKRRNGDCYQNAFGNIISKRDLRKGACYGLTRTQTEKNMVEKYNHWNWDASTFRICKSIIHI